MFYHDGDVMSIDDGQGPVSGKQELVHGVERLQVLGVKRHRPPDGGQPRVAQGVLHLEMKMKTIVRFCLG